MGSSVIEHNFIGRQQLLVGEFIGTWFAWDGVRAMDVLLAQDGVDAGRVGVTGNSGGGNMTIYAVANDPRITMSASSCWVSSWHHNGVNEEPIDAEQCALNALGLGMEQCDLLLSRAPMPTRRATIGAAPPTKPPTVAPVPASSRRSAPPSSPSINE